MSYWYHQVSCLRLNFISPPSISVVLGLTEPPMTRSWSCTTWDVCANLACAKVLWLAQDPVLELERNWRQEVWEDPDPPPHKMIWPDRTSNEWRSLLSGRDCRLQDFPVWGINSSADFSSPRPPAIIMPENAGVLFLCYCCHFLLVKPALLHLSQFKLWTHIIEF